MNLALTPDCLICDLASCVSSGYSEAFRNREAARSLRRRFTMRGMNLIHLQEAEARAAVLEWDLATLRRHPCKGSRRLQG